MKDETGFDPEEKEQEYEEIRKLRASLDLETDEVERRFWQGVLDDVENGVGFIIVA